MTLSVLHITPTYRPAIGGIEAVVENLCCHLRQRGVQADVAHVAPGLRSNCEDVGGLSVRCIPVYGHSFVGLAPGIAKAVRGYDLLHVHDPQLLSLTASLMVFGGGKPAVLSTHGGFHHTQGFALAKSLHERWLMTRMLKRYRLVLASSRSDEKYFSRFAEHVVLAENGVDVSRFSGIRASGCRSPWNWLYWGRLSRSKRLDLVISLAARARNLGYPVNLTITGRDFDGVEASLRVLQQEMASFVKMPGTSNDADLEAHIARAGIYMTASEHEGFGLSVIEAMAAGLVVICRDMEPLNGFVDAGCGLLLKFDDTELDNERLAEFLSNIEGQHPTLQGESMARVGRYSWPIAADRFLRFYEKALGA